MNFDFRYKVDINNPFPMPKFALRIPTIDHRDRDFLKTFHPSILAGTKPVPVFPESYDTDAGLWMPNQTAVNPEFPNTEAQPFGCTNYSQCDISSDLDGKLHDPQLLENITHANRNGGAQLRDSLIAAKSIGLITGFYNVKAYAPLDYFDAMRLASLSGLPEKRSVSVGTPWGFAWNEKGIARIVGTINDSISLTMAWHNWKVGGWKTINGVAYLKCKPWMGKTVGDGGWLYFDRATINVIMNLKWTIAFTATNQTPNTIKTIDINTFDYLKSFVRNLSVFRY